MKATRINEIKRNMTAFTNTTFTRDELFAELIKLQNEMATIAYGPNAAEGTRFYEISRHYSEVNASKNHIADELVAKVDKQCNEISNLIRADISGRKGENKAFGRLNYLLSQHGLRKNVEISKGEKKTEIDALVVTEKAAFIIEVKNTKRDIFIDEGGQYYRTGEYLKWDSNIGAKLYLREAFVREAANRVGLKNLRIVKVVVFTDNRIKVHNKCLDIRTCFLNQLTSVIDTFKGQKTHTMTDVNNLLNEVDAMETKSSYEFKFDVETFKSDFAEMVATLEDYTDEKVKATILDWNKTKRVFNSFFNSKKFGFLMVLTGIVMFTVGIF